MAKTAKLKLPESVDVLIAGGGYVGLSCAVAIKDAAPHLSVMVVDPVPEHAVENDERASAIAADASRMLDALGLWQGLVKNAQPINEMIVTDSKVSDVTRPVFLTFANDGKEDEPFAHMVENRELVKALRKKGDADGVVRLTENGVASFETEISRTNVTLNSGDVISTKLLVACDGVRSRLRDMAGIQTVHWPYDQKGIVCTVEHERPHEGRAEEHFLPAGPFAILPLKGNRSSLVWTESSRDADRLLAQDELIFETETAYTNVTLNSGDVISTKLLVACDGVRSRLRDMAGIQTVHWPYDQKGIVCTVEHERPHEGRAEEHFLPAGPFAILPLKGNRSSLVWTESSHDADRLLEQDELIFEIELEQRFGYKLGDIKLASKVQAFPLGLRLAREFVRSRFVLAGDAAHGIHPIAGQGLNLGFKDAAALAQTIVEADRLGQDFGTVDILERYQMWRRFDTVQMGVVTDVLNRLFSNDNGFLRAARSFGLGVVDRMPAMKKYFINQASGENRAAPKLLRGEAI